MTRYRQSGGHTGIGLAPVNLRLRQALWRTRYKTNGALCASHHLKCLFRRSFYKHACHAHATTTCLDARGARAPPLALMLKHRRQRPRHYGYLAA